MYVVSLDFSKNKTGSKYLSVYREWGSEPKRLVARFYVYNRNFTNCQRLAERFARDLTKRQR